MKLRYLATVVLLALTTAVAHAQYGIYMNPIAIRVSNSKADSGPFAFLGQHSTSQVFYGYNLGGYYDFYHTGKLSTGFDMRFADLHANNGLLRDFMVGLRISDAPFTLPIKPYVQLSGGIGTTKAPQSSVKVSKGIYQISGGADWTLAKHVDLRAIEIGYGSLTTVSSGTVGSAGNINIPSSKLLSFSSGLVFRF